MKPRSTCPLKPTGLPLSGAAWAAGVLFSCMAMVQSTALAQVLSDTTPPVLRSVGFSTRSIDVTAGNATLNVTAHVTDDLSGFSFGWMTIYSPSYGQSRDVLLYPSNYPCLDCVVSGQLEMPQFSEGGEWTVEWLNLQDSAGNAQNLNRAALLALGVPRTLTVVSDQDVTPPQIASWTASRSTVDVSSDRQSITYTLRFRDTQSGVAACYMYLTSPASGQQQFGFGSPDAGGLCSATVAIPRYAEAGAWRVDYRAFDNAGNQSNSFDPNPPLARLNVTSAQQDIAPPALTSLSISPNFIDTTQGPMPIVLTMTGTDNLSGIDARFAEWTRPYTYPPYFYFTSPSGGQGIYVLATTSLAGSLPSRYVTLQGQTYLPQYAEAGTWTLFAASVRDEAGNELKLNGADLDRLAAAYPIQRTFQVILPSRVADGTVTDPTAPQTIRDDVFHERAQVTIPAGEAAAGTTVSIDVLGADLHATVPQGFSTNGTNFVTIALNPERHTFGPPGLTITLPLLSQMAPGASLVLYRVDPVSGALTPEPGPGGAIVIGRVNPDGLSATFSGVASLSTLVGLIPSGTVIGDLDGDGMVSCADIAIVRAAFGKRLNQPGFDSRADTNRDNVVNVRDLAFVSRGLPAGLTCRITSTGATLRPQGSAAPANRIRR